MSDENDNPPVGIDHPTVTPTNYVPHNTNTVTTMGHIVFDASAPSAFVDLVRQTLEQSEFITTEWYDMDGHPDDVLLIKRVH